MVGRGPCLATRKPVYSLRKLSGLLVRLHSIGQHQGCQNKVCRDLREFHDWSVVSIVQAHRRSRAGHNASPAPEKALKSKRCHRLLHNIDFITICLRSLLALKTLHLPAILRTFIPSPHGNMYILIPLTITTLATLAIASVPQIPLSPLHHDEHTKQSNPAPLSCTIQLPTSYQQIAQNSPTTSSPQSNLFNVSQAQGGTSNVDTLLQFTNIPSGAGGPCTLLISFTRDFPINSTGSTLLNVYAFSSGNAISKSDTYQTYFPSGGRGTPKGMFLWTSITITGQAATLNSGGCPAKGSWGFLFQIASETGAGAVAFADAGNNLSGIGGFYMTYSC